MRWLSVLCLLFSIPAESTEFRENWFLTSIKNDAIRTTLYPVINERSNEIVQTCGRQIYQRQQRGQNSCAKETDRFFRKVRSSVTELKDLHYEQLFFAQNLKQLSTDPMTTKFLDCLKNKLNVAQKLNLWTESLQCPGAEGSKFKALRLLGMLFYDKSYHSKGALAPELEVLKDQVLATIISKYKGGMLSAYPPGVNSNGLGLYHFYTIGNLAAELNSEGVPRRCAIALPYALNEWYEKDRMKDKRNDDVFAGFAATLFALSDDDSSYTGPNKIEFEKSYLKGRGDIGYLYQRYLGGKDQFCSEQRLNGPPAADEANAKEAIR
jgi:hypothetical protein